MNNQNQLLKLSNQELSTKYQKSLQNQYSSLQKQRLEAVEQQYPALNAFQKFALALPGNSDLRERRIANKNQLLTITNEEVLELSQQTFSNQLAEIQTWASDVLQNIIENNQLAITTFQKQIDMKNANLQEKIKEVEELKQETIQLKTVINTLEEQIKPLTAYLSPNSQTAHFNASLLLQDKAGWTIEQLQTKLAELEKLLIGHQANKVLLESKVQQLTGQITLAKKKEENWEQQKATAREILARRDQIEKDNLTLFNQTALANTRLKSQIIAKDQTIQQGLKYLQQLENELTNHQISLELKERNITELKKLNFHSKVKLQSLLFLDSLRTFLPFSFSNGLTTVETSIFVSNLTNYPKIERTSWLILFLLLISSVLYTLYKFTKFTIFKGLDFFRWLRGKKTDLNSLKEQELEEWRNKWNIEKNYSSVDLKKVRNDKERVNIEINDLNDRSNLKVNNLPTKKKKLS